MISEKKLLIFLDSIVSALQVPLDVQKQIDNPNRKIKFQEEINQEEGFLQEIQTYIQQVKNDIALIVKRVKDHTFLSVLVEEEVRVLAELKNCLKMLNQDTKYLLQEGILILFLNLEENLNKIAKINGNSLLQTLIRQITRSLSKLIKKYFVYQEYKNNQKQKKNTRNLEVSAFIYFDDEEDIDQSYPLKKKQSKTDSELLKDIDEKLNSNTIQDLIDNYLENEIMSIKEKEETCRICSKKVKLQSIEKHVKLCSKKQKLKQKLAENKFKSENLKKQITEYLQELTQQTNKNEEDESLKKVISSFMRQEVLVKDQVRSKKRSGTMTNIAVQKITKSRWEILLYEHEAEYNQFEPLTQYLNLERQRIELEKNLLDVGSLFQISEIRNGVTFVSNIDSLFHKSSDSAKILESCKSRKSDFDAEKKSSQRGSSDEDIMENENFHELKKKASSRRKSAQVTLNPDFFEKIKPVKTGKVLFPNFRQEEVKSLSFKDSSSKNYSSLQQIRFQQDQNDISINSIYAIIQGFEILKVLGKGAFGKVYLVRRKQTEDVYALKIIAISEDCTQKDLQNIKNEHQIFKKIEGDHLVKAPFSFSEKGCHIFVMELMPGGDLKKVLTEEVYFEEQVAKFYLAEIVLAIEHLHKYEIIHRDLKPENIVLDKDGHIKLTDFGLSADSLQKRLQKSKSIEMNNRKKKIKRRVAVSFKSSQGTYLIGTPDYIAPEIINHISTQNKTLDWWSLGVMAYEILVGSRPFSGETIEEVIENIQSFNIDWPEVGSEDGISAFAKDFIQKLLDKNFTSRLGANGIHQIKEHPFFKGIDWSTIKQQNPPFDPNIAQINALMKGPEDQLLRKEVEERVGKQTKNSNKLRLQNFVRYDLLGSQTIENVEKIVSEKKERLNKLRSCKTFDMQLEHSFKSPSISEVSFN